LVLVCVMGFGCFVVSKTHGFGFNPQKSSNQKIISSPFQPSFSMPLFIENT